MHLLAVTLHEYARLQQRNKGRVMEGGNEGQSSEVGVEHMLIVLHLLLSFRLKLHGFHLSLLRLVFFAYLF